MTRSSDGWWWISTVRMTVAVLVQSGRIADGPPIVRKFIGQASRSLGRWMRRQGGFVCQRLGGPDGRS